jgi:hypothetical protein
MNPKKMYRRNFSLLLSILSVSCHVTAQQGSAPKSQELVASTPYSIGAKRAGVVNCIGKINQVTSFLTGTNANSGMVLNSPDKNANKRIVSTVIEVGNNVSTSFVSASFAPGANESECSASYDAITYWSSSCQQVASANFSAFKPVQPLLKSINLLDGGLYAKVFLMPAGTGCISIKKEMVY